MLRLNIGFILLTVLWVAVATAKLVKGQNSDHASEMFMLSLIAAKLYGEKS